MVLVVVRLANYYLLSINYFIITALIDIIVKARKNISVHSNRIMFFKPYH